MIQFYILDKNYIMVKIISSNIILSAYLSSRNIQHFNLIMENCYQQETNNKSDSTIQKKRKQQIPIQKSWITKYIIQNSQQSFNMNTNQSLYLVPQITSILLSSFRDLVIFNESKIQNQTYLNQKRFLSYKVLVFQNFTISFHRLFYQYSITYSIINYLEMEIQIPRTPETLFSIEDDPTFLDCTLSYSNSRIQHTNIIENFENLQPRFLLKKKPSRNMTLLKLKTVKLPNIFQFQASGFKKKGVDNNLPIRRLSSFTERIHRKCEDKRTSPFRSIVCERKLSKRIDCNMVGRSPFSRILCGNSD